MSYNSHIFSYRIVHDSFLFPMTKTKGMIHLLSLQDYRNPCNKQCCGLTPYSGFLGGGHPFLCAVPIKLGDLVPSFNQRTEQNSTKKTHAFYGYNKWYTTADTPHVLGQLRSGSRDNWGCRYILHWPLSTNFCFKDYTACITAVYSTATLLLR